MTRPAFMSFKERAKFRSSPGVTPAVTVAQAVRKDAHKRGKIKFFIPFVRILW